MRACIAGNGSDQTAAAVAFLKANRQLYCADLFQLMTYVQGESWSQKLLFTTFDRALTWNQVGTFSPARISRGSIDSKVGLEVSTLELEWYLRPTDLFFSPAGQAAVTMLQSFERGLWDNGRVMIYRAVMPTAGDCNTYGAMTMFNGRVAESTITRTGVQLKVNALTELFDLMVPTNLIEANNISAQFAVGQPPAGLSSAPTFTVTSSTVDASGRCTSIAGTCTGPNAGQTFAADVFDFGYIQFASGTSLGQLRASVWLSNGNEFLFYAPLPWAPQVGEAFTAYVPAARGATQLMVETHVVPTGPPYVVQVSAGALFSSDVSVTHSGTPVAGYSVDDLGNYTFPSADEGWTVVISYNAYLPDLSGMGFPFTPVPEASA